MREKYCCTWCFRRIYPLRRGANCNSPPIIRESNSSFDAAWDKSSRYENPIRHSIHCSQIDANLYLSYSPNRYYRFLQIFPSLYTNLQSIGQVKKESSIWEIFLSFLRTWKNSWIHLNIFVNWTNSPEKDAWAMCKEKKKYFYHN